MVGVPSCAVAPPLFVKVIDSAAETLPCAVSGKESDVGANESMTGVTALPLRLTVAGLFLSLLAICNWAVRVPVCVGANATWIWQVLPAARVLPQLLAGSV